MYDNFRSEKSYPAQAKVILSNLIRYPQHFYNTTTFFTRNDKWLTLPDPLKRIHRPARGPWIVG